MCDREEVITIYTKKKKKNVKESCFKKSFFIKKIIQLFTINLIMIESLSN